MGIVYTTKQEQQRDLAAGPAKFILAYGGSRSGKTFGFCSFIDTRAWAAPNSRHLILRAHSVSAKKTIGMDTMPKVTEASGRPKPTFNKQDGFFAYENGSEVWLGGLDDNNLDKILGAEYATIYFNEASEYGYNLFEHVLTRLAQNVKRVDGRTLPLKVYADLNPTNRTHWTFVVWHQGLHPISKQALDTSKYTYVLMNPHDNAANLPDGFIESLEVMSEAQRKRFLLGEYSADDELALWHRGMLHHVDVEPVDLDRIVVGVDPAASSEPGANETGVICAGIKGPRGERRGYVLDDDSGVWRPEEWARKALAVYHAREADCIVAEKNQGGDMVEAVIRAQEAQQFRDKPPARVKLVSATRGKLIRAEPISGLYERGLVQHVGEFPVLEDQMCSFVSDMNRQKVGYSPDRLDALVWSFTELFGQIATRKRTAQGGTHVAQSGFNPLSGGRQRVAQSPRGWHGL